MIKTDKEIFVETLDRLEEFKSDPRAGSKLNILKEMTDELFPGPRKDFFQRINEKVDLAEEAINSDDSDLLVGEPEKVMKFYKEAKDIITDITQVPLGIPAEILKSYMDILTACIDALKVLTETADS